MEGMLYSGECYTPGNVAKQSGEYPQTFRGMSPNIPGNALKHSAECRQTFRGMSLNIPENALKHSGECPQTFQGMFSNIMSPNISKNVLKHFEECPQTFRECPQTFLGISPNGIAGMFVDIPRNVSGHSPECLATFPEMFGDIPRNITSPPFPAFPAFCSPLLYPWFYT